MWTKSAAAVGLLALAAPGAAAAGNVTPIQYAYGGGSNAAAVIASQPPASANGASAGAGGATGAGGTGASGGAAGGGGAGASGGSAASGGHGSGETNAQPVVGLSGSPASPASSSFDALHHAIPTGALWAIAFAAACAIGAWLVRRRSA